jgi:hypothetical protein
MTTEAGQGRVAMQPNSNDGGNSRRSNGKTNNGRDNDGDSGNSEVEVCADTSWSIACLESCMVMVICVDYSILVLLLREALDEFQIVFSMLSSRDSCAFLSHQQIKRRGRQALHEAAKETGAKKKRRSPQHKLFVLETLAVQILVGHWLRLELRKIAP